MIVGVIECSHLFTISILFSINLFHYPVLIIAIYPLFLPKCRCNSNINNNIIRLTIVKGSRNVDLPLWRVGTLQEAWTIAYALQKKNTYTFTYTYTFGINKIVPCFKFFKRSKNKRSKNISHLHLHRKPLSVHFKHRIHQLHHLNDTDLTSWYIKSSFFFKFEVKQFCGELSQKLSWNSGFEDRLVQGFLTLIYNACHHHDSCLAANIRLLIDQILGYCGYCDLFGYTIGCLILTTLPSCQNLYISPSIIDGLLPQWWTPRIFSLL